MKLELWDNTIVHPAARDIVCKMVDSPWAMAYAEYIVACVNACHDLSIDHIRALGPGGVKKLMECDGEHAPQRRTGEPGQAG
jgi:hypothetical protein